MGAPYKMGRGRLVIDGGYPKLYNEFWNKTAGTERYVKNASAWLLNMHSRIVSEATDIVGGSPSITRAPHATTTNPSKKYRPGVPSGHLEQVQLPCAVHRRLNCSVCRA